MMVYQFACFLIPFKFGCNVTFWEPPSLTTHPTAAEISQLGFPIPHSTYLVLSNTLCSLRVSFIAFLLLNS